MTFSNKRSPVDQSIAQAAKFLKVYRCVTAHLQHFAGIAPSTAVENNFIIIYFEPTACDTVSQLASHSGSVINL